MALLGAAAFLTHRWSPARPRLRLAGVGVARGVAAVRAEGGDAARVVLVRNGNAAERWIPKDRLLKEHCGAYTTARTVDRAGVFELSMHCTRLHDTASAILARTPAGEEPVPLPAAERGNIAASREQARRFLEAAGPDGLMPLVRREIGAGLKLLGAGDQATAAGPNEDYQVTLLLTWDTVGPHTPPDRGFDVFTFVQPLPYVEPMVAVEAHRAERKNPTIKDVQWVSDRQQLEELQRRAQVNEVIMFDADGRVTEGLQTNFFAVAADGTVLTAPDERVLAGTVRKVVLEVAHQNGIPVRFECPNISDLSTWESCFVCSTSRLVKPIRELGSPELSSRREFPASGSLAHRLAELVQDAVRKNSEPLQEE